MTDPPAGRAVDPATGTPTETVVGAEGLRRMARRESGSRVGEARERAMKRAY